MENLSTKFKSFLSHFGLNCCFFPKCASEIVLNIEFTLAYVKQDCQELALPHSKAYPGLSCRWCLLFTIRLQIVLKYIIIELFPLIKTWNVQVRGMRCIMPETQL